MFSYHAFVYALYDDLKSLQFFLSARSLVSSSSLCKLVQFRSDNSGSGFLGRFFGSEDSSAQKKSGYKTLQVDPVRQLLIAHNRKDEVLVYDIGALLPRPAPHESRKRRQTSSVASSQSSPSQPSIGDCSLREQSALLAGHLAALAGQNSNPKPKLLSFEVRDGRRAWLDSKLDTRKLGIHRAAPNMLDPVAASQAGGLSADTAAFKKMVFPPAARFEEIEKAGGSSAYSALFRRRTREKFGTNNGSALSPRSAPSSATDGFGKAPLDPLGFLTAVPEAVSLVRVLLLPRQSGYKDFGKIRFTQTDFLNAKNTGYLNFQLQEPVAQLIFRNGTRAFVNGYSNQALVPGKKLKAALRGRNEVLAAALEEIVSTGMRVGAPGPSFFPTTGESQTRFVRELLSKSEIWHWAHDSASLGSSATLAASVGLTNGNPTSSNRNLLSSENSPKRCLASGDAVTGAPQQQTASQQTNPSLEDPVDFWTKIISQNERRPSGIQCLALDENIRGAPTDLFTYPRDIVSATNTNGTAFHPDTLCPWLVNDAFSFNDITLLAVRRAIRRNQGRMFLDTTGAKDFEAVDARTRERWAREDDMSCSTHLLALAPDLRGPSKCAHLRLCCGDAGGTNVRDYLRSGALLDQVPHESFGLIPLAGVLEGPMKVCGLGELQTGVRETDLGVGGVGFFAANPGLMEALKNVSMGGSNSNSQEAANAGPNVSNFGTPNPSQEAVGMLRDRSPVAKQSGSPGLFERLGRALADALAGTPPKNAPTSRSELSGSAFEELVSGYYVGSLELDSLGFREQVAGGSGGQQAPRAQNSQTVASVERSGLNCRLRHSCDTFPDPEDRILSPLSEESRVFSTPTSLHSSPSPWTATYNPDGPSAAALSCFPPLSQSYTFSRDLGFASLSAPFAALNGGSELAQQAVFRRPRSFFVLSDRGAWSLERVRVGERFLGHFTSALESGKKEGLLELCQWMAPQDVIALTLQVATGAPTLQGLSGARKWDGLGSKVSSRQQLALDGADFGALSLSGSSPGAFSVALEQRADAMGIFGGGNGLVGAHTRTAGGRGETGPNKTSADAARKVLFDARGPDELFGPVIGAKGPTQWTEQDRFNGFALHLSRLLKPLWNRRVLEKMVRIFFKRPYY